MPISWINRWRGLPPGSDLIQPAQEILNAADAAGVCQTLSGHFVRLVGAAGVQVLLWDAGRGSVSLVMKDGQLSSDAQQEGEILLQGSGLQAAYKQALRGGEPVVQAGERGQAPLAVVPISLRDKVFGVVGATGSGAPFNQPQVDMMLFLAAQAAAALETGRLDRADRARRQVSEALLLAGRKLSDKLSPMEVPVRILEQLAEVVPYERGSLLLQEGDAVRIMAQRGFPKDERTQRLRILLREGDVFQQIAMTGRPSLVDDVTQDPGWQQVPWLPLNHSWLGVPLFRQDAVIGMVSLTRQEKAAFSPDDVLMAATFALHAAAALENATLYEEITQFNQQLEEMVQLRTEELKRALDSLERLDRNKSDFINMAAHELRTPLTVMKGYLIMLESEISIRSNPYLSQAVDGVLKGTERLHEIINSMLDLARIDNQVLNLMPEMVSLVAIIKRITADDTPYLDERRITMDMVGFEALPVLNGDATLLLKVFQNVIINAIKYTPDGGAITLAARCLADPQLGECLEVTVQDTGIGIDPEQHELIFEKLYSTGKVALHSSGKASFKGGGPGLGLAIARGIVQAHGGRIWVESERQDEDSCPGSCFHILLPVRNTPQSAPNSA